MASNVRRARNQRSPARRWWLRNQWYCATVLLLAPLLLGLGGVLTNAVLLSAVLGVASIVASRLASGSFAKGHPFAKLCLALSVLCVVQVVPFPYEFIERISPRTAELWKDSLEPLGIRRAFIPISVAPRSTIFEALKYGLYAVMAVVGFSSGKEKGRSGIARTIFFAALAVSAITQIHSLLGFERYFGLYSPSVAKTRAIGPLLNPNNAAAYYSLGGFAGLGIRNETEAPNYARWLGVTWLFCSAAATGSRAGTAALLGSLLVYGLATRAHLSAKKMRRSGPLIVLAVLFVAAISRFLFTEKALTELVGRDTAKLDLLRDSTAMILDFPLTGIGRGAFGSVSSRYHSIPDNVYHAHPENFALQWAIEWGLPSTVMIVILLGLVLRPQRWISFGERSHVALGLGVLTVVVQNLLDLSLEIPLVAGSLILLVSSSLGAQERNTPVASRSRFGAVVIAFVSATLIATIAMGKTSLVDERARLANFVASAGTDETADRATELAFENAIRSYPGDFFLARLRSVFAAKTHKGDAGKWLNRSLEACPRCGRTHLWAAMWLGTKNVRQAMLEIRMAVSNDNSLPVAAADLAASLTTNGEILVSSAPKGAPGVTYLSELLARFSDASTRKVILLAIKDRAPDEPRWKIKAIQETLRERGANSLADADKLFRELRASGAHDDYVSYADSKIKEVEGREEEAHSLLGLSCDRTSPMLPDCLFDLIESSVQRRSRAELKEVESRLLGDACGKPLECVAFGRRLASALHLLGTGAEELHWLKRVADLTGNTEDFRKVVEVAEKWDPEEAVRAQTAIARTTGSPGDEQELLRLKRQMSSAPL